MGAVDSVEIARAETERGEVVLRRRTSDAAADVVELRVNGVFVMDTLETTSEIELAAQALDLVDAPAAVLIGGLGLGFTLQRVLADPRVERAVGRRDRGGADRVDARRHRPARTRAPRRRPRHRGQRRHHDGDRRGALDLRPGAARRRQRPRLPRARGQPRGLRAAVPAPVPRPAEPRRGAGRLVRQRRPRPARRDARGLRQRRGAGPRRAAAGPAGGVLPLPRRGR